MTFSEFGLQPALLRGVEDLGFEQPTPIQRDAIPPAMQGRDVLACAMTGSGKTAAFLLPVLHRLAGKRSGVVRALVLSPTRELAAQIDEHRHQLARHTRQTGVAVFGGVGMVPQERAFRSGVDVMVATPGRLLDHLRQPYARLDGVEILILDEADRMLDMGFLPDIRRVLSHLPKQRQTLLFSATMPGPIVELAREMLHQPVTLNIEREAKPATGITHAVYAVDQTHKSPLLLHLLRTGEMPSVVAFTRTKHRANRLAEYLAKHGIDCARIHGNRSQSQRTEALAGFKRGDYRVLVATDIAARGIDVEALSHVVNFDVPHVAEDYIHRVGRTARAEATGDAFTFVAPDEEADLRAIEKALGKRIPRLTAAGFDPAAVQAERPEVSIRERLATHAASRPAPSRPAAPRVPQPAPAPRGQSARGSQPAAPGRGSQPRGPQPPRPAGTRDHGHAIPAHQAHDGRRPVARDLQASAPPSDRRSARGQRASDLRTAGEPRREDTRSAPSGTPTRSFRPVRGA